MSTRTIAVLAAAAAAVSLVACVPSPPELCKSGVNLTCDRTHECTPDDVKDGGFFTPFFGTSAADCKTKLEAAAKCSEKTTQDELCTQALADGGTMTGTYHLDKASACSDAVKALTCADYLDSNKLPAACKERCTY